MKAEENMTMKWKHEWASEWEKVCRLLKNSGLDLKKIKLAPEEVSRS